MAAPLRRAFTIKVILMKSVFSYVALLGLATTLSFTGCKKSADPVAEALAGRWQLTSRQCFCPQAPFPNEIVVFTPTNFSFYKNSLLTASGTYLLTTITAPCSSGANVVSGLRFTVTSGTPFSHSAAYTVSSSKLVLDYGGPCDAPVDTYTRLL